MFDLFVLIPLVLSLLAVTAGLSYQVGHRRGRKQGASEGYTRGMIGERESTAWKLRLKDESRHGPR